MCDYGPLKVDPHVERRANECINTGNFTIAGCTCEAFADQADAGVELTLNRDNFSLMALPIREDSMDAPLLLADLNRQVGAHFLISGCRSSDVVPSCVGSLGSVTGARALTCPRVFCICVAMYRLKLSLIVWTLGDSPSPVSSTSQLVRGAIGKSQQYPARYCSALPPGGRMSPLV